MKKLKQLLALLVVILLLGLYALTLVFALMKSPAAQDLLLASLYATVILPVLIYAILLVYKWRKPDDKIPKIDEKHAKVNTIIFDLGKVLVDYDWQDYLKSMAFDDDAIEAVGDAMFASDDWVEADRGVQKKKFYSLLLITTRNMKSRFVMRLMIWALRFIHFRIQEPG